MGTLLRVEAVDLGKSIGDTADLSTIRGSSLILLDTVRAVRAALEDLFEGQVETVNQGGSLGLFFITSDEADPKALGADVRAWLSGAAAPPGPGAAVWPLARLMRFEVTCTASNCSTFLADADSLLAHQRWRQMQAPRLTAPAVDRKALTEVCDADQVSPGKPVKLSKSTFKFLSPHVLERRAYGIAQKHRLYQRVLAAEARDLAKEAGERKVDLAPPDDLPDHFARHMDELAVTGAAGRLAGKIALIYADGNRFGALQRAIVAGEPLPGKGPVALSNEVAAMTARQRQGWFDRALRVRRAALLKALLVDMTTTHRGIAIFEAVGDDAVEGDAAQGDRETPKRRRSGDRVMRLETQLWAGDEMIWAVPAALAFPVIQLLFDQTKDWAIEGEPLTHAVGLVLCHHDAPITRIRALAQDLANHGKALLAKDPERRFLGSGDVVAYEVLESFDHLGGEVEAYREKRLCATGCQPFDMLLTPARLMRLATLAADLAAAPDALPRRQSKRLAQCLHAGGVGDPTFIETKARLEAEQPAFWTDARRAALDQTFGPALWLHLDALFDYLPTERREGSDTGESEAA